MYNPSGNGSSLSSESANTKLTPLLRANLRRLADPFALINLLSDRPAGFQ